MGAPSWWSSTRAGLLYFLIGVALVLVYFGQSMQAFEIKVYAQSLPTQLKPVIMKRLEAQGEIKVGKQVFDAGPATVTIQDIKCPSLTLSSALLKPETYDHMQVAVEDILVSCGGQMKLHLGPYTSDWHNLTLKVSAHALLGLIITQAKVGGQSVRIQIQDCNASLHAHDINIEDAGVFSPIIGLGVVQDAIAERVDTKLNPEVCGIIGGVVGESHDHSNPHAPLAPNAPIPDQLKHQKYEEEKYEAEECTNATVLMSGGASYSVWEGVRKLYEINQTLLATTLLVFSGVWPYVKLVVLLLIHTLFIWCGESRGIVVVEVLGSVVELIGKWSMVDVLFTGLLVATLRLSFVTHFAIGSVAVYPREGALIYTFAVALSLILSYLIISGGPRAASSKLRVDLLNADSYPELSMDSDIDDRGLLRGRASARSVDLLSATHSAGVGSIPRGGGGTLGGGGGGLFSNMTVNGERPASPSAAALQVEAGGIGGAGRAGSFDDTTPPGGVPPERRPLRSSTAAGARSVDLGLGGGLPSGTVGAGQATGMFGFRRDASSRSHSRSCSHSSCSSYSCDEDITFSGQVADICISWPVSLFIFLLVAGGVMLPLFTVTKVIDINILDSWDIPPAEVQNFSVYSLAQYVAAREAAIMTCTGRRAATHAVIANPPPSAPIAPHMPVPNVAPPTPPHMVTPNDAPSSPLMLPTQGPATFGDDPLPIVPSEMPFESTSQYIQRMLAPVTVVFFVCTLGAPILRALLSVVVGVTHSWPVGPALGLPSDTFTRRRRFFAVAELFWSWDMIDVMYLGLVLLFLRLEEMVHAMSSGYCTFFLSTNLRNYPAVWMLFLAIILMYLQSWAARILHNIDLKILDNRMYDDYDENE